MERRCCARVAPGVEPTIVFGTPPVAGSRTLHAFVFDLGSHLGSIHFFLSKLLSVVVSIYWQGPTGTRYLPATRPGSVQTQTQNIGYNRHFRSTLNTWHARRYSTYLRVKKVPRNTQCNISTLLPDPYLPATQLFFQNPTRTSPILRRRKNYPLGPVYRSLQTSPWYIPYICHFFYTDKFFRK